MRGESASPDARYIANWVADSGDNRNLSFVIIDKKNTKVFVFDASAKLVGATPVLLGAKVGDDSVLGIGQKKIADVLPEERTTPAGRFMGEPGRNLSGENVVWVDYDAAVSMHRVRIVDPKERRLERLASPTTADNRISYGCVNVPIPFFEKVLAPVFNKSYGVVYVLPEERQLAEIFASAYDPAEKYGQARAPATFAAR
ncbi:MAG: L,D-transpeptidase [Comamonadaceae bacterium]|nr:MAG: L,D-transpeptidase [Comamonadaceae bacterium]